MADRKSLFSRFWPQSSSSPRRPAKQTIAPPPPIPASPPRSSSRRPSPTAQRPTAEQPRKSPSSQEQSSITSTNPIDEPKTTSPSSINPTDEPKQTSPSSTNPTDEPKITSPSSTNSKDEPKTSPSSIKPTNEPKTTSPSSIKPTNEPKTTSPCSINPTDEPKTTPPSSSNPKDEPKTISPPSTKPIDEPKTISPPSTKPIDEPKTTSPSRTTTQSSTPSKPTSPDRRAAKSRSPPQPSSPGAQRVGSQIPKRASNPRLKPPSPQVGSSSSPKRTQPKSPSKELRQPSQAISPKPVASQQELQLNPEVETDSTNDFNGKTLDGTSLKNDEVGPPSQSSEMGTAAATSEQSPKVPAPSKSLNAKPGETEYVKEVVQATNTKADEETNKGKSGSEDQIIEKTEIPNKLDQLQRDEQEALHTKETSGNTRNSQSKIIRSTHNKPSLSNGENVLLHKNIKDNMSKFANQMVNGDPKGVISDKHVSVITLAGENRGASMKMESNSSKREGAVHIHRGYKINPDESPEATTDGEGSSDRKKSDDAYSTDDQATETYVNNNAQGINNSIVFNSSITEGNPGVHMVVTHLPKEPNKAHFPETRKAEFNTTRAEKLTYQPTVRRRCLKGLFLETSDSDPENPEKPRRHGCRVGCEKVDKENNVDVL